MRQGIVRCRSRLYQRALGVALGAVMFGACSGVREQRVEVPVPAPAPPPVQAPFSISLARKIRGVFRFRYRHKNPHVVQVQC